MRTEVAGLVAKGMTHDQVIEYFVKKHGGQDVLAAPIDRGFNRVAWLLPYGVGLVGVALIGRIAWRWSHRSTAASAPPPGPGDAALERRLDDELRDLD